MTTFSADLYGPDFFVGRRTTVVQSAAAVVPLVDDLLAPTSVLDVGCGYGEWMDEFAKTVPHVAGVDIADQDRDRISRHDLTEPLDLGVTFDLVVCLEVAEHLPARAADTLVDTCVRHGATVMFSGAVVGQGGAGHINEQPHEYWHRKFADRGYSMFDLIRPLIADNPYVSPWYRDNIFIYSEGGPLGL